MKAKVDKDTCTGCELCVDTCPDIFYMDGDTASAKDMEIPAELEASAKEAEEGCPVDAIIVE